ncbi:MAG: PTS transporter subunit EIIC [Bacillota bacterium]|nr:PTS transporter subunit EIIC [Bacillota bacterium]
MTNKDLALAIIEKVGGKENISNVTHCVTRLRLVLKNADQADVEAVKGLEGVINVVISGGQHQVVLGPIVGDVYEEAVKVVGVVTPATEEVAQPKSWKDIPKNVLDFVISCFVPAIPVFAGAGMIKVLAVILSTVGVLQMGDSTYTLLNTIGDAIFYFLPFVVAINAANKLKVNPMLALALAAVCLHPNFISLVNGETPATFCGIALSAADYSAQAIPMMFGVWLLKYVDKFMQKVSPKILSVFLVSMVDLLIVAPIIILVVGPISIALNNVIFGACAGMMSWGWIAVGINAALFPLMVLTGTHNASIPLIIQMFATIGYDPIFLVSGLAANIAEAGAAAAVAVKTKNKTLKSTASSATVSAMLGITEPALYGVNLRLKRPFIAMMIGSFIGGCFCGLIGLQAPAFATPSLITCALFVPQGKSILFGFLGLIVSFVVTFVIAFIMGFEDIKEN